MPRSKWPEQRRTKATRSRCLGSMLAWTLKTKPVTGRLPGADAARLGRLRTCGRRAVGADAGHQLLHAEGVDRRAEPDRREVAVEHRLAVEGGQQFARHLHLLAQLRQQVGGDVLGHARVVEALHLDALGHACCGRRGPSAPAGRSACRSSRGNRAPGRSARTPGQTSSCSSCWISSMISKVSRASRSILLQKVRIGRSRSRQTSKSLRVWLSTPLAPSITMTAASTAVSVR